MTAEDARLLFEKAGQPLPAALRPVAPAPAAEGPSPWMRKQEEQIHLTIMRWLDLRGWKYLRARMDKRSPFPAGWPDFTVFIPAVGGPEFGPFGQAVTVFLEIKTSTGVLSEDQRKCIADLEAAGFSVLIPRSDREAIEWLCQRAGEKHLTGVLHPSCSAAPE